MSRREEIMKAALPCFVEHGVEPTTIEMICKISGASVGSLYHHFGSKEGLAADVYIAGLRAIHMALVAEMRKVTDAESAVRRLVHADIDWIVANPVWANYIFHYRRVLVQVNREESFRAETEQAHRKMWARIKQLQGGDLVRDIEVEVAYCLFIAPIHEYARRWLDGRYAVPLDAQREVFADAAWASVRKP